ncbi:transglycosylase SLT domain-containing protein [Streptomyces sodiiphilus]|uniref:transglycosylase SLT domain-containing protein n=1 Tax=Streptomyces sodiiphilus TaxID=226217 RepID=UPI0031DF70DD
MTAHISRTAGLRRLARNRRAATATLAGAGATALALTLAPAADAEARAGGPATVRTASVQPVSWEAADRGDDLPALKPGWDFADRVETREQRIEAQQEAAAADAAEERAQERAERSAGRGDTPAPEATVVTTALSAQEAPAAKPQPAYPDTLDGWIREALAIMEEHGIPGTYDGLHRNTIRESSGDPNAINLWDINAVNGTPSIGLLQVIQPTFDAYHVPGTPKDIYHPVANLTAAANYAADRYGSIDNVNGPY